MRPNLPILTLTALAACQPADSGPTTPPPADACGAARYAPLLGTNAATLAVETGTPLRIVGPDTAVTLDYRPERVNLRTDRAGTILSVDCG